MTRQAAFQRFGPKVKEAEARGGAMMRALLGEAPELAKEVVRAIVESRIDDAVTNYFGAEISVVLTPDKLARAWGDLVASFGEWEDFTGSAAVISGDYVVAETRLEFEAGTVTCRSTWSAEGRLAGLYFVPVAE
ncbi:DUF3887 domain-containing protein [Microbacterium sp. Se63.02b]|uniref:DUF3887 domain-containing protein n=1 Tax=Microbacterium sp. Se63.02b TaxID=2709304 RepID=UPI001AEF2FDE|nr:DUF3887 domain-containing protein [Microbacterium sp. Se63.02b]